MHSKKEYSKKITTLLVLNFIAMAWAGLIAMIALKDIASISHFLIGVFGVLATITGFYFHKSKNENLLKIQQGINYPTSYPINMNNDYSPKERGL